MKPHRKIILVSSFVLLVGELITWWICCNSSFNIPEFIPFTPINIYGLCLSCFIISNYIITQKQLIKLSQGISMLQLIFVGTIIGFVTEAVFQAILLLTIASDKLYQFLQGTILMTIFFALLSFLIAFQLKTRRTVMLLLFIVVFTLILSVLVKLFPR